MPEDNSIVPSFIEATGDQLYMRFHGKNRENWFKRNITAAERYKYSYSERELRSLARDLHSWKIKASAAHTRSLTTAIRIGIMNGTTMGATLRSQQQ